MSKKIDLHKNFLPGRNTPIKISGIHAVNHHSMLPPWPVGMEEIILGLGCFWGAERLFWQTEGVFVTAVGYAGGVTPHPTYEEVCTDQTGHAEVVRVVFNPQDIDLDGILKLFWEAHDPTQGDRQGNDRGSQYRSAIFSINDRQLKHAQLSAQHYQNALNVKNFGLITTEIKALDAFYYAEEYHQQYLAKNPQGYCALKGTGVTLF